MGVLLIATGGTIASRPTPAGVRAELSGADLVARCGLEASSIEVLDLSQGPSWAFGPAMVERLARTTVSATAGTDVDGVVVTHGTDTLEESLFLTWLLGGAEASERCPIVFTGAMRHADHPEADGPANLREAVALASAGGLEGPVARIGGSTLHARWARKTDTSALDAFRAVGLGSPAAPARPPAHGSVVAPDVAEVHAHTGVRPAIIDQLLEGGAAGLVVVGSGAGNVHADLVPGITRAIGAGVPVVVTSRCWTGPVAPRYGGPGGGRFLADLGCILPSDLPANKARLALSVALGVEPSVDGARRWFGELLASAG